MSKRAVVCTLFEGHYHYGVAALINSLYKHGFRGEFYAGYRNSLPSWSLAAKENASLNWPGARTVEVAADLHIHFLPLETDYHLTNYKPKFLLQLWEGPARDSEAIAYFDPDIVVKCRWSFYETWMKHGVALVHEIISNDMPMSHPIRMEWRKIISMCNRSVTRDVHSYINGGFCGVSKENIEFLSLWSLILDTAIKYYISDPTQFTSFDKSYPFNFFDQDALNVATMCSEAPISEMGPEGMDFTYGGWTMSHATGTPKPWKKEYIISSLKGISPSLADKEYWKNCRGVITNYSELTIWFKKFTLSCAAFIGRFYHRQ